MKILRHLIFALLAMNLVGCVSFTPSGPLGIPEKKADFTYPHGAQVTSVVVSDPKIRANQQTVIGKQMGDLIGAYVERGEYFQRVISFPSTVGNDDVVLKFSFSSLRGKRTPHPGYFPGAFLTLTMWIWVNGPIYTDKYNLVGDLVIETPSGQRLASSQKTLVTNQNVGLWDNEYFGVRGAKQVNQLVDTLMQDATRQLPRP